MKGKSSLTSTGLPILIVLTPILIPFGYGLLLKYRAQSLCDAIKIGSMMNIERLKDDSSVEFNQLRELAKGYGSTSYGIHSNYVLLNFSVSYFGYRCVVKTESDVVADKKVCLDEVEDDDQCFDFFKYKH